MWKSVFAILIVIGAALCDSPLFHCPEGVNCGDSGERLEASSFEFLNKLSHKSCRLVVDLTISNASINKIDPKLKYLKNLEYLDLSDNNVQLSSIPNLVHLKTLKLSKNNLKNVNMTALPPNIEELDLSNNLLTQIPKDWQSLRNLKILHIYKNPIDCNCYSVLNYERIIQKGIRVSGKIMCHAPTHYIGKDIASINCSPDDIMQDEQPEGSGSGDIFDNINEEMTNVSLVDEKEDEAVVDSNTIIEENLPVDDGLLEENVLNMDGKTIDDVIEQEGSGDEGSGFGINLPPSGILGCIENCSTPGPLGAHDEKYASPAPGVIDQVNILFDDLNIFKNEEVEPTPTTTTTTTTSSPLTTKKDFVKEPRILKENKYKEDTSKTEDVEIISNSTEARELERASVAPQNMTAVYAIVGIVVFLAVIFGICFIKKNRGRRNTYKPEIPLLAEEMKSIKKPVVEEINEKSPKGAANIPEHVPLLNGQNGKPRSDSPRINSYVPLAHPELLSEDEDKPAQTNGLHNLPSDDGADEDIELRPKVQPELLTPERQRVTVRESEIPEPIPKTPLFVHRQKNSEGEIVTTPVP